jgi:peptidoglycan L-alanyl-D-glutamate endopeptidase CwlK
MGTGLHRLAGVHPDLAKVITRVFETATPASVIVTEGVRSLARQKQLVAEGKSRTMNSRHLTGHAVDLGVLVDGKLVWDWPSYERLAVAVKAVADEVGVPIEWGGDWKSFRDGPHFQLPWASYPAEAPSA